jgi:WD40 repeat protein
MKGTNSKALQVYCFRALLENETPQVEMIFEKNNHHQGSIYTLDWSLSGKFIASGSNDKSINLLSFDEKDLTVFNINNKQNKSTKEKLLS